MTATSPAAASPAVASLRAAPDRWVPVVAVAASLTALLPWLHDHMTTDGVSYVAIAEHLLAGDVEGAVNPYWSPLLSWLLAPLLAVGIPAELGLKAISGAAAGAAWAQVRGAARDLGVPPVPRLALGLALTPFLVWAAISIPPDLLVAVPVVAVTRRLARPPATRRDAVVTGALGGVAYLAKLYAAPVVAVLMAGSAVVHAVRAPTRARAETLRRHAWMAAGAVAVGGPWALTISLDVGHPTIGTAASTNVALVADGSWGHPVLHAGLRPPPHAGATSAWEEPSAVAPDPSAPATGATAVGPATLLRDVTDGAARATRVAARWWPLALAAGLGWVVAAARRPAAAGLAPALVAAAAVWTAGLLPVVVQPRYLWAPMLLVAPLAALALDRRSAAGRVAVAVVLGGAMLAVAAPLVERRLGEGRATALAAEALRTSGLDGARVASVGGWHDLVVLCWRLDCAYHGAVRPVAGPSEIRRELREHRIDVLVDAERGRRLPGGLRRVARYTTADGREAAVYRVGHAAD